MAEDGYVRIASELPFADRHYFTIGCHGDDACFRSAHLGIREAFRLLGEDPRRSVGELKRRFVCSACGNRQIGLCVNVDTRLDWAFQRDGPLPETRADLSEERTMCGRYAQHREVSRVLARFGVSQPPLNLQPSWNIAPTQRAPVIRRHPETGERQLDLLRWALTPSFSKDGKPGPFNARAETVATNGLFRQAFAKRRCLVVADAFYEWQKIGARDKQAHAIAAAAPEEMLAFAGIWDGWKQADGTWLHSYAIITTEANNTVRPIHTRMPVILAEPDWTPWLSGAAGTELLRPAPHGALRTWPVSAAVGNVRNNGPELLEPITDPRPQGGDNPA